MTAARSVLARTASEQLRELNEKARFDDDMTQAEYDRAAKEIQDRFSSAVTTARMAEIKKHLDSEIKQGEEVCRQEKGIVDALTKIEPLTKDYDQKEAAFEKVKKECDIYKMTIKQVVDKTKDLVSKPGFEQTLVDENRKLVSVLTNKFKNETHDLVKKRDTANAAASVVLIKLKELLTLERASSSREEKDFEKTEKTIEYFTQKQQYFTDATKAATQAFSASLAETQAEWKAIVAKSPASAPASEAKNPSAKPLVSAVVAAPKVVEVKRAQSTAATVTAGLQKNAPAQRTTGEQEELNKKLAAETALKRAAEEEKLKQMHAQKLSVAHNSAALHASNRMNAHSQDPKSIVSPSPKFS